MKEQKKNKKKQLYLVLAAGIFAIILIFITGVSLILQEKGYLSKPEGDKDSVAVSAEPAKDSEEQEKARQKAEKEKLEQEKEALIQQADRLAASYDYDGAIDLVKTWKDYAGDSRLTELIGNYEETKAACVPVDMKEVTHIFYHSLVVDPQRCFANQEGNPQARGNNQWMTTISEFNKITQEMYDRDYVMVSIHDLYQEVTDENGNQVFQPAEILLPPDKKAFVLSLDDLSYYHSYDGYGYASKMVLDENGKPTCEYIQEDGTTLQGAYDVVPLMDQFLEEHPDASYRGAKGIIALTGYNGILGYRTDMSYQTVPDDIDKDKRKWLEEHPDFSLDTERAEAKKVADAMKEDGWEFASHTWGHLKVGEISLERLQTDTQKWRENVEPLVGPVDAIIFAHGQDLGQAGNYDEGNPKYQYLREQGYRIFCNVDSNQYTTWFGPDYLRQGRRNLDGFRIYNNAVGNQDNVSDLFDAKEIIDPLRPPVWPLG